jgi:UPF0716 protein FxsA
LLYRYPKAESQERRVFRLFCGPAGYLILVPALVLIFIVVPLVELYVMVQVGQEIGALYTVALIILISIVGVWLAKTQGLGVWRRIRQQIGAGTVPGVELLDAFLILLAGVLLLTPGFVTDVLGIILLLPPTRALVRVTLRKQVTARAEVLRDLAGRRRPPPHIDV